MKIIEYNIQLMLHNLLELEEIMDFSNFPEWVQWRYNTYYTKLGQLLERI